MIARSLAQQLNHAYAYNQYSKHFINQNRKFNPGWLIQFGAGGTDIHVVSPRIIYIVHTTYTLCDKNLQGIYI